MNILRIAEILKTPHLLTTIELNELTGRVPQLISEGFVDIAVLIVEKSSCDNIFTSHGQQISTLLLAIQKGHINLLQLLHKKGYGLAQPDVIYNSGHYDHRLYKALCDLIRSGIFHDKPICDFISALDLIEKLCAPGLFEIQRFTQYALSYYGQLGTNPSQYYPYFDALFSYPLNNIDDMEILATECQLVFSFFKCNVDIQCHPAFFPYLIPKKKSVDEKDILKSITPPGKRNYIDVEVVQTLLQEVQAHYRDGKIHFSNGAIEIEKIMDILVKTDTSWDAGCNTAAVFNTLALNDTEIRTILVKYGMPAERIEKLTTYISRQRKENDSRTLHKRIEKMIKNKEIDALNAITAEQLLTLRDYAWNGGLTQFIDHHASNPVFLLLAIFGHQKEFLTMLCDTNQIALIKPLPEDLIMQMDLVPWLYRRAVFQQQHDIFDVWSTLFPGIQPLSAMKEVFKTQRQSVAIEADNKGVSFDEAFALSQLPVERKYYHHNMTDDEILLSSFMEMPIFLGFKQAYQALYPIIQLACLIEGDTNYTRLLTLRLAFLFRSQEKAMMYLSQHQSQFPELTAPVHDACVSINFPKMNPSYELSPQGIWNVPIWADLILRFGCKATKFLQWAVTIENRMTADGKAIYLLKQAQFESLELIHRPKLEKKYTASALEQTRRHVNVDPKKIAVTIEKNTLRALIGMSNKQVECIVSDRLSMKDETFRTLSKQEKKNQIEKYIRHHDLPRMSLEDLLQLLIEHGYKRAEENLHFARESILAGLTEHHFNRCLDMMAVERQNDRIPDLLIEGHTVGYPHFYLKKLAPNDPLGFILGVKTNCCQSIGGDGEACAIHGMTSELGGFYVLFKKNNGRDKVIAQTWAWISKKGNLVFDSIENLKRFDQNMILTFYTEAAIHILQHHKNFNCVVVGMGGNTPDMPSGVQIHDLEEPKDYNKYRDSSSEQNLLASQQTLATEKELAIEKLKLCGELGLKLVELIQSLVHAAQSQWPIWKNSGSLLLSIVRAIHQLPNEKLNALGLREKLNALGIPDALPTQLQSLLPIDGAVMSDETTDNRYTLCA